MLIDLYRMASNVALRARLVEVDLELERLTLALKDSKDKLDYTVSELALKKSDCSSLFPFFMVDSDCILDSETSRSIEIISIDNFTS